MNNIQNLSPEEKRKLLAQLIREKKKAAVPEDIFCITQLFESQAAKTPENTAVEDTQSRLSYRELNARANKLAHYLQSLNIGVNARVGLYLHASPDRIIALLGILKAGGVYVPFAPEYPNSYLTPIIVNAKLSAIVTHSSFVDDLASVGCRVVCLDRERVHIDEQQEEYPKNGIAADDLAYISYDSGRAVPVDRAALFHRLKGFCDRFPFSASDRAGQTLSPMQDAAIVETLAPL
ncbi:MAG: AMP-binding protein, partial [bacterium]|nr:AMP-binding protein [bacterium]